MSFSHFKIKPSTPVILITVLFGFIRASLFISLELSSEYLYDKISVISNSSIDFILDAISAISTILIFTLVRKILQKNKLSSNVYIELSGVIIGYFIASLLYSLFVE